ncbi:MAG: 5'-3' exonuclease H3TH domain-containing protein [Lysobacterales bacterium]
MSTADEPVCLVDASLYIFRAYHSLPPDWHDRDGWPTNAVQGFASFLLQLLEQGQHSHMAVCFDEALDSGFRHEIYPAYKANREPPDEALLRQFAHCKAVAGLLGLSIHSDQRYEADDLIGSLAALARNQGRRILVISADKDLTQLLGDGDEQWDFGRDKRYNCATVEERFGVRPDQIVDLLALAGDPVDNIPGVRGVGQISAARLLAHFGSLDELYSRVQEVEHLRLRGAKSLQIKLIEHREQAFLSRQLTQIHCAAPVPDDLELLRPQQPDLDALGSLFDDLGFGPFLRRRAAAIHARFEG